MLVTTFMICLLLGNLKYLIIEFQMTKKIKLLSQWGYNYIYFKTLFP